MIRNAAAQDIVAFLGILEPKNWPECLMLLVNQLDDQEPIHQEVCPLIHSRTFSFRFSFALWDAPVHWLHLHYAYCRRHIGVVPEIGREIRPPENISAPEGPPPPQVGV
jgi:hypothetical protein